MRRVGMRAAAGRRRWHVPLAVLVAVLLHGAVLTAWTLQNPRLPAPHSTPRQAMSVQWVFSADAKAPTPPAAQREAALPPVPRTDPAAARPAHRAEAAIRSAATSSPPAPPAPPVASAEVVVGRQDDTNPSSRAAAAPQRPASDARTADTLRWSADAVGRADRQEREWQRRHGTAPAAQLAAGTGNAAAVPLGAALSTREWRGGDGARVAQVEGPGGSTYCVRLPSANRQPELGAAPRVAPVSNCP